MSYLTAPDFETAASMIDHRADCKGKWVRHVVGDQGDTMAKCRGCFRFTIYVETTTATTATVKRSIPSPTHAFGYVCSGHLEPVTWRGKGCRACQLAVVEARVARVKRRAAARTRGAETSGARA